MCVDCVRNNFIALYIQTKNCLAAAGERIWVVARPILKALGVILSFAIFSPICSTIAFFAGIVWFREVKPRCELIFNTLTANWKRWIMLLTICFLAYNIFFGAASILFMAWLGSNVRAADIADHRKLSRRASI